jgi:hypothetical protein
MPVASSGPPAALRRRPSPSIPSLPPQALLATEGVRLTFTDGAVRALARIAEDANRLLENIGARRLHTVGQEGGGVHEINRLCMLPAHGGVVCVVSARARPFPHWNCPR